MTTGRKYGLFHIQKNCLEQLINNKNIQFDAKIVDVLLK